MPQVGQAGLGGFRCLIAVQLGGHGSHCCLKFHVAARPLLGVILGFTCYGCQEIGILRPARPAPGLG